MTIWEIAQASLINGGIGTVGAVLAIFIFNVIRYH